MICKVCKRAIFRDYWLRLENTDGKCFKCFMESRTCLDRTGRSSKKDKYKNKDDRTRGY